MLQQPMLYLIALLLLAWFTKGVVGLYARFKYSIAMLQHELSWYSSTLPPSYYLCDPPKNPFCQRWESVHLPEPLPPFVPLPSQRPLLSSPLLSSPSLAHKNDLLPPPSSSPVFSSRGRSDVLSLVSFFPPGRLFLIADPVSAKHITSDRNRYQKPAAFYRPLSQYGMNVGVTEGDAWRRHRKIVTASFSDKTNQLAWDESARVVEDCITDWQRTSPIDSNGKSIVKVDNIVDLTLKIGLFVICAAAFSQHPPWQDEEPDAIPNGHTLSFRSAMTGVLEGVMVNVFTPKWAYKLPIPRLHHVRESYSEFTSYLHETIASRKSSGGDTREGESGRRDLLGALVYASAEADEDDEEVGMGEGEGGEEKGMGMRRRVESDVGSEKKRVRLSDEEVMGNMYVFLLAGHETTAHTLAFTLPLLALYQDEQQKLFEHIDEILPKGVEPSFEDYSKLTLVTATFMETLRLYPSVVVIPKYAMVDTVIPTAPKADATPSENIFIPKWTDVFIDAVALHRNPKYWGDDCDEFKPERFLDAPDGSYKWPRDSIMGFSSGHRSCLGQKFGTVESVAVIALFLRKYSVHLPEDLDGSGEKRRRKGETFEQKVERVMRCGTFITLTPEKTPLVFKER